MEDSEQSLRGIQLHKKEEKDEKYLSNVFTKNPEIKSIY